MGPNGASVESSCTIMFIFAIVFAAVAVLGAAIGLGHVGHPIGGQSVESYGWGLFINGSAIAAFLALRAALAPSSRKINQKLRPAQSAEPIQPARAMAQERMTATPKTAVDLGSRRTASPTPEPSRVTVELPDDPEAILDALIERVGTAGVDFMLRNRVRVSGSAA